MLERLVSFGARAVFAALCATMLGVIGATAVPAAAATHTLDGAVILQQSFGDTGAPCRGDDPYANVKPGAKVVVIGSNGRSIATTKLGKGVFTKALAGSPFVNCRLEFSAMVPDSSIYAFEVAGHRSKRLTKAALADNKWRMSVTLS
jgi:hypothetical protein